MRLSPRHSACSSSTSMHRAMARRYAGARDAGRVFRLAHKRRSCKGGPGSVALMRLPPPHSACSSSASIHMTRARQCAGARDAGRVCRLAHKRRSCEGGPGSVAPMRLPPPHSACSSSISIHRARATHCAGARDVGRVCRLAHKRRSCDVVPPPVPPPSSIRCRTIRVIYMLSVISNHRRRAHVAELRRFVAP